MTLEWKACESERRMGGSNRTLCTAFCAIALAMNTLLLIRATIVQMLMKTSLNLNVLPLGQQQKRSVAIPTRFFVKSGQGFA